MWIDVQQRQPAYGVMVLVNVLDHQGLNTQAVARSLGNGHFEEPISGEHLYGLQHVARGPMVVTHWQELTAPPE
jgi:hypothetical protein